MKKFILLSAVISSAVIIFSACNKNGVSTSGISGTETLVMPATPYNYNQHNFAVSNQKAALGRVLFYDKHLSLNNAVSCASCHKQQFGFADNVAGSVGLNNVKTDRNAMPIQNLSLGGAIFFPGQGSQGSPLFWDSRENDLVQLMLRPVGNHIEMGVDDISTMPAKLNKLSYYAPLVQAAFGTTNLTLENMSEALANFNASIRVGNSRFDKFISTNNASNITALELEGFRLFSSEQYNCNSCHTSMFMGSNINNGGSVYGGGGTDSVRDFAANIGLNSDNADGGVGAVTKNAKDKGMFKIPDLHNVGLTAPYMHDGSKATLEEVLDHYSNNINSNENLDHRLRNADGTPKKLNITAQDKVAIIAFLNSLTDQSSVMNSAFSNPFVIKK